MAVPAWLIAVIRTLIQAGVSKVLSAGIVIALVDWLANEAGVVVTEDQISNVAFGLSLTAIVALVNYLGKKDAFIWLNKILSLWLSNTPALYDKTPAAGGDDIPDTAIDMAGEDVAGERGAVSVGLILAIVALVLGVIVAIQGSMLIGVALGALAVAHLVGNTSIG